ncbi:MAG: hemerythrin domain-containing protein [Elusimicrobia bacterium]|nr:hemerythrin domain-containing protein [Elusimicrobiota bacterium]
MDVIEKLIVGHVLVKERLDLLDKIVKMIDSDAFVWDNVSKVSDFFEKEIKVHFHIEENILFPVAKKVLPKGEQKILFEIEGEHKSILKKIEIFKQVAEKHSKLLTKDTRKDFIEISQDIIENLLAHAQKEDDKLFPLIKQFFTSENYKKVEDLFFKYLKI